MQTLPSVRLTTGFLGILLALQSASAITSFWTGASGSDQFWATPGNWSPSGPPGSGDDVRFIDDGAASDAFTFNNVVGEDRTVQSLVFGHTNGFQNTLINPGFTLTVSNNAAAAFLLMGTETVVSASQQETATISGPGAKLVLVSPNAGSTVVIREAHTSSGSHRATLDMSGLDIFEGTLGRVLIAVQGSIVRPAGTWLLARTNSVTASGSAPAVLLGDGNSNGGNAIVQLGETNTIVSDTITVARQKSNSRLFFNPNFTNSVPPMFVVRGRSASRVGNLSIGDNSAQTTSTSATTGTIDLSGGFVDALVDTCYVARGMNGTGTGQATGNVILGGGILDVNTLEVAYVNISTAGANVTGTVTVNPAGTLVVNNNLRLGRNPGAGITANATLTVNGGTVNANSITTSASGANSTINLVDATLVLTNTAGSPDAPIAALNVTDSVIQLAVVNNSTNFSVTSLAVFSLTNNTINIMSVPPITGYPAQFPILSYGSYFPVGESDFLIGSLPSSFVGYISNNVANSTLDLVLTAGPTPLRELRWTGSAGGDWNTSSMNWIGANLASTTYNQGDFVTFDDGASGSTTVNLAIDVTPISVTVSNNSKAYSFNGAGAIEGTTGLTKDGTGTLTIGNGGANTFSGAVSLLGGAIQLSGGADRLPTNATVVLADAPGVTLNLNGFNQTIASLSGGGGSGGNVNLGTGVLTLNAGGGVFAGNIAGTGGSLIKTGSGTQVLGGVNSYDGGTIVSGGRLNLDNPAGSGTGSGPVQVLTNSTLGIGNAGTGGSVAVAVITNDGTVVIDHSDDLTFTNLITGNGNLTKNNANNTVTIPTSNSYTGLTTVGAGGLRISHPGALGTTDGETTIPNEPTARLELIGGITLLEQLRVAQKQSAAGTAPCIVNVSGSNTLAGPIIGTAGGSYWTFQVDTDQLKVSGAFTNANTSNTRVIRLRGAGGVGDWQSSAADQAGKLSLTGVTKEDTGTWVLSGINSYTGPTTVSDGTLLVNGVIGGGTVTVNGGILGGTGEILAPVNVNAGGTLAPGNSIGTLAVRNDLNLAGTCVMEVSHASSDQVAGISTLNLGGTLQVVINGTLTGGEVFKLFSATTYGSDFGFYDLPTLPEGLGWDFTGVPVDGTLRVTGGPPTLEVSQSGSVLTFSWGAAGYKLQAQTNSLNTGLSNNWVDYPAGGNNPVNVDIDPKQGTVFFRLISQ